jgi:hypothetical protein
MESMETFADGILLSAVLRGQVTVPVEMVSGAVQGLALGLAAVLREGMNLTPGEKVKWLRVMRSSLSRRLNINFGILLLSDLLSFTSERGR